MDTAILLMAGVALGGALVMTSQVIFRRQRLRRLSRVTCAFCRKLYDTSASDSSMPLSFCSPACQEGYAWLSEVRRPDAKATSRV